MKNPGDTWRIAIPTSLLDPIINWYHHMLAHVVLTRLNASISTHFYDPTLKARVEHIVSILRKLFTSEEKHCSSQ